MFFKYKEKRNIHVSATCSKCGKLVVGVSKSLCDCIKRTRAKGELTAIRPSNNKKLTSVFAGQSKSEKEDLGRVPALSSRRGEEVRTDNSNWKKSKISMLEEITKFVGCFQFFLSIVFLATYVCFPAVLSPLSRYLSIYILVSLIAVILAWYAAGKKIGKFKPAHVFSSVYVISSTICAAVSILWLISVGLIFSLLAWNEAYSYFIHSLPFFYFFMIPLLAHEIARFIWSLARTDENEKEETVLERVGRELRDLAEFSIRFFVVSLTIVLIMAMFFWKDLVFFRFGSYVFQSNKIQAENDGRKMLPYVDKEHEPLATFMLAITMQNNNRKDEAELLIRKLLTRLQNDRNHIYYCQILCLETLAAYAASRHDVHSAENCFKQAVNLSKEPDDSLQKLGFLESWSVNQIASPAKFLATFYAARGQDANAASLYQQIIEKEVNRQAPDYNQVPYYLDQYAKLLKKLKQSDQIKPYCVQVLAKLQKKYASNSFTLFLVRKDFADEYKKLGLYADAEGLYKMLLASQILTYAKQYSPTIYSALADIAAARHSDGEAERLYGQALQSANEVAAEEKHNTWFLPFSCVNSGETQVAEVLTSKARYLLSKRQAKSAELVLLKALSVRKADVGINSIGTSETMRSLGQCYMLQNKFAQAKNIYKECLDIMKTNQADPVEESKCMREYAQVLRHLDKTKEAEDLEKKAQQIWIEPKKIDLND